MENTFKTEQGEAAPAKGINADEIKSFYKNSFPAIFKAVFAEPMEGTRKLFGEQGPDRYRHSITLIATAAVVAMVLMWLFLPGDAKDFVPGKAYFGLGLVVALLLVVISVLSFAIKSTAGKVNFKEELLTGALCGLPLIVSLTVVAATVSSSMSRAFSFGRFSPESLIEDAVAPLLAALFGFLLMSNIMQQSLRASKVKDAIAWYGAPIAIALSFYLTERLFEMFFK